MVSLFHDVTVTSLARPDRAFGFKVADEVPLRLTFNGMYPYGVMMVTPDDLEDFAIGFCLTEQIIPTPNACRSVVITGAADGLAMDISIAGDALARLIRSRPRARTGHTSCGICGSDDIPADAAGLAVLPKGPIVPVTAIRHALDDLGAWQVLNAQTRMVHAAAWADSAGRIMMIREDVGRHNAVDKLIGARAREGRTVEEGFCVLTSRYSLEMALKTLRAGISMVVAVSAPTYRAFQLAKTMNQTLIAVARRDGQILFCGGERLER
ncbi:formate dehydrogenase accessory sulfurtransferase FdhD [Nguyenibacter vanlangensis]|uniref:Sulfur carrier protein FdhD n=1 Tax=Nguyenibacter vanlangensis TaxID=1216886 RepID=A0A7Y7IVR1_9PROT|nr:formate dehydrogenase accessory sulfurtransferase FdhD [Nguyenibacter vanlangensis]NVN10666.1 formate dehydrogenase accessory sulfurtransferase FdhD [Nguyenibacter vanlangensis]